VATNSRTPFLALFSLLLSCTAEEGPTGVDLSGRTFVSESLEGRELVPGTEIRVSFDNGEISAYAGCNSMSGAYEFDGYALIVNSMSTTEIGCEAALHDQDEWLSGFLRARPTTMLEEPRLTMSTEREILTLLVREVASPDRELVGTHWVGSGIGDGASVSFGPASTLVTIDFGTDGTVAAFTGCESGSGGFAAGETTIGFTDLTFDGAACPDPSLEEQSDQVLFVLDGSEVSYRIEEAELRIERAGRTLYFSAEE
jgi:heat shock protein HslJ